MARRPQGVQSYVFNGAGPLDVVVKANPGKLYSFEIQWTGGTADDLIHIHDTAVADATATKRYTFRFPTATGSYAGTLPEVGIEFLNGLWLNFQVAGPKVSITLGFD